MAVSTTAVPVAKLALQLAPQLMPLGLLLTVPPLALLTVRVWSVVLPEPEPLLPELLDVELALPPALLPPPPPPQALRMREIRHTSMAGARRKPAPSGKGVIARIAWQKNRPVRGRFK